MKYKKLTYISQLFIFFWTNYFSAQVHKPPVVQEASAVSASLLLRPG
jgi:hypothetical protein